MLGELRGCLAGLDFLIFNLISFGFRLVSREVGGPELADVSGC